MSPRRDDSPRQASLHMDVLSSRVLVRPKNLSVSRTFYRDVLGLAVYREFGDPNNPAVVLHAGNGLIEVSSHGNTSPGTNVELWMQVRHLAAEFDRLAAAGVTILREPQREPWGLDEMWIADPDGIRIVLVEVPAAHPLRRDTRLLP
jgi:catechol 2,3-dioxygenase-like lactoylglutathione lyase family enzyme